MLNGILEAERPPTSVGPPSGGWAASLTPLTPLYGTGPRCPFQAIIRHPCLDPDLGPCPARLIRLTLYKVGRWSAKSKQGSSWGSCPTFSSPNPHYNPTFESLTLCQVLSGGRQRQISQILLPHLLLQRSWGWPTTLNCKMSPSSLDTLLECYSSNLFLQLGVQPRNSQF